MTSVQHIDVDGATLACDVRGDGPALLLVHGFPHTRRLWDHVAPDLARTHTVVSLDMRGCGDSSRPESGFDAATQARDIVQVLDALDIADASVVAIDAGVPPSFLLAVTTPARVRQLVLIEATLGRLPGAEQFFGAPPWWFGFHSIPGFAERIVEGKEGEYLDFFYRSGTFDDEFLVASR